MSTSKTENAKDKLLNLCQQNNEQNNENVPKEPDVIDQMKHLSDDAESNDFPEMDIEIPDDVPDVPEPPELPPDSEETQQQENPEPEEPKSEGKKPKSRKKEKDRDPEAQRKEKDEQTKELQARQDLVSNLKGGETIDRLQKEIEKKDKEIERLKVDLKDAREKARKRHPADPAAEPVKPKVPGGVKNYAKALFSGKRQCNNMIVTCCVIYSMFLTGLLLSGSKGTLKQLKNAGLIIWKWIQKLCAWHDKAAGWTRGFLPDPAMRNVAGYIIMILAYGILITAIVKTILHFRIRLIDKNYLYAFLTEILMMFMLFLIMQTWKNIKFNTMLAWIISIPICFILTEIFYNKNK